MDELDQGQTHIRVLAGRQGTFQEIRDSVELLLHTDAYEAWIIPSQAADVCIIEQWSLWLHFVRKGHCRTRAVPVRQLQRVQEAIEREGTNGWCHMASSFQLLEIQENIRSPPLLCEQSPTLETGGRMKAKRASVGRCNHRSSRRGKIAEQNLNKESMLTI